FIIHHDIEKIFEEFKTFFNIVEAAGGLVYNSNGQILMIKRRGKWDLPKGKKEQDESPDMCAVREVKEECSIDSLDVKDLLHITYHSYTQEGSMILKKTYWYKMFHEGESSLSPQKEEEITEVKWVNPEDLPQKLQNTYPSIVDVIRADKLY
ncbi:MAG: NUDIX hydrolase, partial [Bacteroidota bacterium]